MLDVYDIKHSQKRASNKPIGDKAKELSAHYIALRPAFSIKKSSVLPRMVAISKYVYKKHY